MRPSSRWPKWHCSRNFYFAVASVLALMGFCFCAMADASHVIKYGPNPPYDNIPITPKTWEQVDLIYYSTISGHRYINSIQLLRPKAWLHKRHMDVIGSKVTLSIPEFGIVNVMATVKAIKPTRIDTRGVDWSKQKSAPVIGKFMHYVTDVRTYTFKDSLGNISHINATPNHPFYVKNKHGFVAIGNVSDEDTLVGAFGSGDNYIDSVVHLVCAKSKHSHCGKAFGGDGLPTPIYNFEAYRRHTCLIGKSMLLTHNYCGLKKIFPHQYKKENMIELEDYFLFQEEKIKEHMQRTMEKIQIASNYPQPLMTQFRLAQYSKTSPGDARAILEIVQDQMNLPGIKKFDIIEKYGAGNCDEQSYYISKLLNDSGIASYQYSWPATLDHAVAVTFLDDRNQVPLFVVDPWAGIYHRIYDYEKYIGTEALSYLDE